jgi:hypothetical protein
VRKLISLTVGLLALALAATAFATVTKQNLEVGISPAKKSSKSKPRPVKLTLRSFVTTDDGSKASPASRVTIKFPKGFAFNGSKFKTCSAATLNANQINSCPSGSKLGGGTAIVNATPVVTDPVTAKITVFNDKGDKVNIFAQPAVGQPNNLVGKIKKSGGGIVLDVVVPPLHTIPGQPDATLIDLKTTIGGTAKKSGKTYGIITAPTKCPSGGWAFSAAYTHQDGQHLTADSKVKCS